MGLQVEYSIMRLQLSVGSHALAKDSNVSPNDVPKIWRGNNAQFQIGCFLAATILDLTNAAAVTCEIWDNATRATTRYLSVASASFSPTPTAANWANGTDEHAEFNVTAAQMNLPAGTYWLVFGMVTQAGDFVTFGGTTLIIEEDGIGNPGPIQANPPPTLSQTEQFQLFVQKHADQANEALGSDNFWYVWGGLVSDGGTGKWHKRFRQVNADTNVLTEQLEQTGVVNVP